MNNSLFVYFDCLTFVVIIFFSILIREHEMDAKLIVQMDGKKTRLHKPKYPTIDNNIGVSVNRDNFNDFTFDHSYWSFDTSVCSDFGDHHMATQEEVYNDLGTDVVNSAFQGTMTFLFSFIFFFFFL